MYVHTTSREQAEKSVAFGREHIASAATDGTPEYLHNQVQALAKATKRLHHLTVMDRIVENLEAGRSLGEALRDYLGGVLAVGAEDTWSGRGNDLRRVEFEAVQDLYREVQFTR